MTHMGEGRGVLRVLVGRPEGNLLPSTAKVKNVCTIPPPQYIFMALCLVKHRDNFTLPCIL
jgi:hypothetical protein